MKLIYIIIVLLFVAGKDLFCNSHIESLRKQTQAIDSCISAGKYNQIGAGVNYDTVTEYLDTEEKLVAAKFQSGAENSAWGTLYFDNEKLFAIELHKVKHVLTYDPIKDDTAGEYVIQINETYYITNDEVFKYDNLTKTIERLDDMLIFNDKKYSFIDMCYLSGKLSSKIKNILPEYLSLATNNWLQNIIVSKTLDMKLSASEKCRVIIRSHNLNYGNNFIRKPYQLDTLELSPATSAVFKDKNEYEYYDIKLQDQSAKDTVALKIDWISTKGNYNK